MIGQESQWLKFSLNCRPRTWHKSGCILTKLLCQYSRNNALKTWARLHTAQTYIVVFYFLSILGIDVAHQKWTNLTKVKQARRQNEIVQMCWNDNDCNEVCLVPFVFYIWQRWRIFLLRLLIVCCTDYKLLFCLVVTAELWIFVLHNIVIFICVKKLCMLQLAI